uniref:Uncharacterized protein n=1 Tax=Anguilla anguilla TaxID=7936 RepID=A0A0E9SHW9_ANGAN
MCTMASGIGCHLFDFTYGILSAAPQIDQHS